jgi:hypothetical protein
VEFNRDNLIIVPMIKMTMNKKTQIKKQIMPLCQNSILMRKKK